MLVKELEVYERLKEELLKKYENKVVAIKDEKVIGIYNGEVEALGMCSRSLVTFPS